MNVNLINSNTEFDFDWVLYITKKINEDNNMKFVKTNTTATERTKTFFAWLPITIRNLTPDGEGYIKETRWLEKVTVKQFRSRLSDIWYDETFIN
jgi:hypothetical protein